MNGQKIYIYDQQSDKQVGCVTGHILPRKDEILTIFDVDTGIYHHYTVISASHGCNTGTNQLVSTVYVKHLRDEQK